MVNKFLLLCCVTIGFFGVMNKLAIADDFSSNALKIEVLQEEKTELEFAEVLVRKDWKPVNDTFFAGGYSHQAKWLKLTFDVPKQDTLLLTLLMAILDDVRLYVPDTLVNEKVRILPTESGVAGWRYFQQGDTFPFQQRELDWRGFSFMLQIPEQKLHTVYLRLFSSGSLLAFPQLWTVEKFQHYQKIEMLIAGFFAGSLILFTIIAGFVYFFVRKKLQLFYFLFLISSIIYMFGLNGFMAQYVFPNQPKIASNLHSAMVGLEYSVMCLFHIEFFFKYIRGTFIYYLQQAMMVLGLITAVFAAFDEYALINEFFLLMIVIVLVIDIPVLISFYKKGLLPKNLFVIYMFLSASAVISTSGFLGSTMNTAFFSIYGVQINQLITLSILLMYIFNETRKQITAHALTLSLAKSQAQAFESQRYWLAMLTHEIKTPVSIINASCDSIEFLNVQPAVLKRLDKIKRSTQRIDNLVKRFLQNDEIQLRLQNLQRVSIDLKTWISEQLQFFDEAAQKRLQLKIRADLVVVADTNLLAIALSNLITNALKYSQPNSTIEIDVQEKERENQNGVLLTVRDFGNPIAEKQKENLYQRHQITGSNVGLWACREIARAHHGDVWLENTPNFKGNVFNIWLPK